MSRIIKPYFVIYNNDNIIIHKSPVNSTYIATGMNYGEFDTEEELEQYIENNNLKEINPDDLNIDF